MNAQAHAAQQLKTSAAGQQRISDATVPSSQNNGNAGQSQQPAVARKRGRRRQQAVPEQSNGLDRVFVWDIDGSLVRADTIGDSADQSSVLASVTDKLSLLSKRLRKKTLTFCDEFLYLHELELSDQMHIDDVSSDQQQPQQQQPQQQQQQQYQENCNKNFEAGANKQAQTKLSGGTQTDPTRLNGNSGNTCKDVLPPTTIIKSGKKKPIDEESATTNRLASNGNNNQLEANQQRQATNSLDQPHSESITNMQPTTGLNLGNQSVCVLQHGAILQEQQQLQRQVSITDDNNNSADNVCQLESGSSYVMDARQQQVAYFQQQQHHHLSTINHMHVQQDELYQQQLPHQHHLASIGHEHVHQEELYQQSQQHSLRQIGHEQVQQDDLYHQHLPTIGPEQHVQHPEVYQQQHNLTLLGHEHVQHSELYHQQQPALASMGHEHVQHEDLYQQQQHHHHLPPMSQEHLQPAELYQHQQSHDHSSQHHLNNLTQNYNHLLQSHEHHHQVHSSHLQMTAPTYHYHQPFFQQQTQQQQYATTTSAAQDNCNFGYSYSNLPADGQHSHEHHYMAHHHHHHLHLHPHLALSQFEQHHSHHNEHIQQQQNAQQQQQQYLHDMDQQQNVHPALCQAPPVLGNQQVAQENNNLLVKPDAAHCSNNSTSTLRTVLNSHHKQLTQRLSVRFQRIRTVYNLHRLSFNNSSGNTISVTNGNGDTASQAASLSSLSNELHEILAEVDHYTLDWRKRSMDCLELIAESTNCTNIIITRLPLVVALGHLICLGFSQFFDIDQVYSASKSSKEACIKRIKKRFGATNRCSYIIVGDKEDSDMAKRLDLPCWNTSRSDGHRQLLQLHTALKEGFLM